MRRRPLTVLIGGLVILLVIVFGVGQLVLPPIATSRIRSQLARSGTVDSVSVSAFPAIELLWHHADRVTIHLGSYHAPAGPLDQSLTQTAGVSHLTVTAADARLGLLTVRDATLTGDSGRLAGSATIAESDLRGSIPFLQSVTPVASAAGALVLRGTADVLGLRASVDATVAVSHGALIVAPDVPLGALATVTVFSQPGVTVRSIRATRVSGGFRVAGTARAH